MNICQDTAHIQDDLVLSGSSSSLCRPDPTNSCYDPICLCLCSGKCVWSEAGLRPPFLWTLRSMYLGGWPSVRATGPQNFQYNPVIWFEWLERLWRWVGRFKSFSNFCCPVSKINLQNIRVKAICYVVKVLLEMVDKSKYVTPIPQYHLCIRRWFRDWDTYSVNIQLEFISGYYRVLWKSLTTNLSTAKCGSRGPQYCCGNPGNSWALAFNHWQVWLRIISGVQGPPE